MTGITSSAAYHIKTVTSPISGKRIGFRIQVAVINKARYDVYSEEYMQSFAPRYLITESGDYSSITDAIVNEFLRGVMVWHKITDMRKS